MDEIRAQYVQLSEAWESAYDTLAPNPAAYQPYVAGASLDQLNDAVKTLGVWLNRVRAPKGFAPTYQLSRSLAATSVAGATTAAQALSRGELGHFPSFIAAVTQAIAAVHTAMLFSETSLSREAAADLGGKLSETIAVLETAHKELASKTELLESVTKKVDAAEEVTAKIGSWSDAAQEHATAAEQHSASAAGSLEKTRESAEEVQELKDSAASLLKEAQATTEALTKLQADLGTIIKRATDQETLIDALLPKGVSAGLASAFAGRVSQLERSKWLWVGVFVLSMILLFSLAWRIVDLQPLTDQALWQVVLQKVPLAAPMVWLGWFAAVQYGNTLRVQEDYAFKEATSKAFAGYRDHMEHLANVNLQEGNTAMTLMAQRTIEILAHEPLRIFQGTQNDAAPAQGFLSSFRRPKS